MLTSFSTDRFRRNPASPQEQEETEEHHAAAKDSREAGFLGEYQPGEERRDNGLGEDGAGDHRRLDVAERPVKYCVAHELGTQRYRPEPEPGLARVAPEPDVEDEHHRQEHERGGGVYHHRV